MKIKQVKTNKDFDSVKTFRAIKEKISKELVGKSPKQIMEYLKKNSLKLQTQ